MPQYDESFLVLPERGVHRYKISQGCLGDPTQPPTPALLGMTLLSDEEEAESSTTPNTKPRGGKLARRARSFKEDFLEILSQMRSPGGGSGQRSGSPHSPKTRTSHKVASVDAVDGATEKNPLRDLDLHVKQVQFALKHFHDVVTKKKLEMLAGNGTIVLETVTTIHGVLKSYVLNEHSSTLVSATNKVYQSLAKLIKLCDDVLLQGDKALDKENVSEVIQLLEDAVQNLVSLAQDQIANRETSSKALGLHNHHPAIMDRTSCYATDLPQRSSLPDIPLTPRERQILEQTSSSILERHGHGSMPHSQSSESILNDSSPPPKPPLPGRIHHMSDSCDTPCGEPPPLPPKRRNRPQQNHQSELQLDISAHEDSATSMTDTFNSSSNTSGGGQVSGLATSFDRISLRSKSPEDTSSLLSASAGSLDSVLNHSREEEEIQVLMDQSEDVVFPSDNILTQGSAIILNGNSSCCCWDSSSSTTSTEQMSNTDKNPGSASILLGQHPDLQQLDSTRKSPLFSTDLPPIPPGTVLGFDTSLGKLSSSHAESGFASMHSLRSSSQSYTSSQQFSSRSSQQSAVSFTSTESTSNKVWQVQRTATESNFTSTQRVICSSETLSPHHTESIPLCPHDKDLTRNVSPEGNPAVNVPPALPQKTRPKQRKDRQLSTYDNVPSDVIEEFHSSNHQEQHILSCSMHQSQTTVQHGSCRSPDGKPPPLPLKKKHIMAYMEMFGNCSHPNTNEFLRHSVHTYNLLQAEWQQQEMSLTSTQSCSFSMVSSHSSQMLPGTVSVDVPTSPVKEVSGIPPALPPKRNRTSSVKSASSPPPMSPPPSSRPQQESHSKVNYLSSDGEVAEISREEIKKPAIRRLDLNIPAAALKNGTQVQRSEEQLIDESNPLEELDISKYLVMKKSDEEGPDVRGGHPDALIIHATKANKNEENETDFLYQEAFLTTYRTFLSPLDLIRKLRHRHERFSCSSDVVKQRAAREAFSLLVRVVSDLTMSDLDNILLQTLMDFVYQLLCSGDLTMAKALRVKIIEKCNAKHFHNTSSMLLSSLNIYTRQASLLDFKSEQIAEQMTLLDAELFMKIEIPEVLIWAQEQNEERSPNLTRFTEHFNKMSYWARSRILEQNEAKDRERYVVKFIKIMKHLRKINNFNSYLALLSALDSAPIRRLEWQKQITEGLKEYCALIDSSSSFRAYRQALAETQPPCIPYIGLVLQDLTFVHIGNNDLLHDGSINFSKRWQQFNIVENMKRFKKGTYSFKKHERIIAFFSNFDEFLCEEAMWQISESIKPRGGKKPQA